MKVIWVIAMTTTLMLSTVAWGQVSTSSEGLRTWKRGAAIVMFSGLAGGVLGLSTLSFYGEPEEHTTNVTTGALLGLIGGAGYLMWESQRQPINRWGLVMQQGSPAVAWAHRF